MREQLSEFLAEVEANLSCPDALGRILSTWVESRQLGEYLASTLSDTLSGSPSHLRGTNVTEMALASRTDFLLYLRRVGGDMDYLQKASRAAEYIRTPGRACIVFACPGAAIWLERYGVVEDGRRLILRDRRLHEGGPVHETLDGDLVWLVSGDEPVWTVRLNFGRYADEVRFYDRESLGHRFSSVVRGELSSFKTLCQVLGISRDRGALPHLRSLVAHEAHIVRWAALQAVGRIDGGLARGLLTAALDDPHPSIRTAAQRSLDAVGG